MKANWRYLSVACFVLFTVSFAAAQGNCSLATYTGSYGFLAQGTILGESPVQVITTGLINYDGAGHFTGKSIDSIDGSGGLPPGTFSGTYIVNPDCTLAAEQANPDGTSYHFVTTIPAGDNSAEYHFMLTDPGLVAYGTARRIPAGGCSLATLKGSYALYGQGVITAFSPAKAIVHVGALTYDGAGHFAGTDTIVLDGMMIPDMFTGTYSVTEDCEISVEILSTAVGVLHETGRVTGEGKSHQVHLIVTDPFFMVQEGLAKQ